MPVIVPKPAAAPLALAATRGDRRHRVADLGQQDHIGRAGQPGLQRDPAGVAAHGLKNHHPAVALAGDFQPAQRVSDGGHRGVEAKAAVVVVQVVVDRLGHAHHRQSPPPLRTPTLITAPSYIACRPV